jgi:hypothetical protein
MEIGKINGKKVLDILVHPSIYLRDLRKTMKNLNMAAIRSQLLQY